LKKSDGIAEYNDWRLIDVVPDTKKINEEDRLGRLEVSMNIIGKRMADQVRHNGFGAYIADDERYDCYVVQWTGVPYEAEKDEVFDIEGNQFTVQKGDMVCEGVWLDLIPGTTK